jgi:hypothetical protein
MEHLVEFWKPKQQELFYYLDYILIEHYGLTPKKRYHLPFYDHIKWICYINPLNSGGVEICFTRGCDLSDKQGLLQARGRKQISGIVLKDLHSIPFDSIQEIIQEAIQLDERMNGIK